jgi:hypothetical protein
MHPQPATLTDPRQRTLFFLLRPELWALWPFLPLVRRKPDCEEEAGLLYDALHARNLAGYACTVFLCNFFLLPETDKELFVMPRETFDTFEDIANAGWTVD